MGTNEFRAPDPKGGIATPLLVSSALRFQSLPDCDLSLSKSSKSEWNGPGLAISSLE